MSAERERKPGDSRREPDDAPSRNREEAEVHDPGPPYGSDSRPTPHLPVYGPAGYSEETLPLTHAAIGAYAAELILRSHDGAYVTSDGRIIDANESLARIVGVETPHELVGRFLRDFLADPAPDLDGVPAQGSVKIRRPDGVEGVVEHFNMRITTAEPGKTCYIGLFRELHDVFERGFLHTQRLATIGSLAGQIAHDLNNFLLAAMGYARLLLENPTERVSARTQQIVHATNRASDLTERLLALAQKTRPHLRRVDLARIVEETTRLLEVSVSPHTELKLDRRGQFPMVMADETQVRQVVMNLILNASEALGEDRGRIRVRLGSVRASPLPLPGAGDHERLPDGVYVFVEVSDTGPGMDEETRQLVFDPYFSSKREGRGLGLVAVAEIARAHHAAVHIESAPGRGARFRVLFPAARDEPTPTAVSPIFVPGRSVLVVDGEDLVRELAETALREGGFRVFGARTPWDALQFLKQTDEPVTLAIVEGDVDTAGLPSILAQMQSVSPGLKVILTGILDGGGGEAERFAQSGVVGVLEKPYTPKRLLKLVRDTMT